MVAPVETLRRSWFYWPRLSITPIIAAQSAAKWDIEIFYIMFISFILN